LTDPVVSDASTDRKDPWWNLGLPRSLLDRLQPEQINPIPTDQAFLTTVTMHSTLAHTCALNSDIARLRCLSLLTRYQVSKCNCQCLGSVICRAYYDTNLTTMGCGSQPVPFPSNWASTVSIKVDLGDTVMISMIRLLSE